MNATSQGSPVVRWGRAKIVEIFGADLREELSWEKPQYVAGTLRNEHWRKYLEVVRGEEYADQRQHFGHYICREWNARYADTEQLKALQITFMEETTLPKHQSSTPQKVILGEYSCS